jgi:hypothetical protein
MDGVDAVRLTHGLEIEARGRFAFSFDGDREGTADGDRSPAVVAHQLEPESVPATEHGSRQWPELGVLEACVTLDEYLPMLGAVAEDVVSVLRALRRHPCLRRPQRGEPVDLDLARELIPLDVAVEHRRIRLAGALRQDAQPHASAHARVMPHTGTVA